DGRRIATASLDRTAQIWDAFTGRPTGRPVMHASGIHLLTFAPDGRRFATGSDDNTVRIWDAATGDATSPPMHGNATPSDICFSPDGHGLLVARHNRITLLWELITPADETTGPAAAPAPTGPKSDALKAVRSADGRFLVAFGGGQPVRVRRAVDHEPVSPVLR